MEAVPGVVESVARRLAAAGCTAADEEAAELLEAAPDPPTLESWLRRRETGEPPAWIIGTTRFCGLEIHVAPGVYVPRLQSEELARRAAELLAPKGRALDLCTGAGAIAAFLRSERPEAVVLGTDCDPLAATCALRNGVPAVVADLAAPLRSGVGFDVVTAVAPYVPSEELCFLPADVQRYEPEVALRGGPDGLDVVRRVVAEAASLLRGGGWLLLELGGDQQHLLEPGLRAAGFGSVTAWWDEDGDLRGLAACLDRR